MKNISLFIAFCLIMSFPTVMRAEGKANCKSLQNIFDTEIKSDNGVCTVELVREDLEVSHMGKKLSPKTMELVFHFSFQNVGKQTAVMGELALLEKEVNSVIDELRNGDIEVSALHNHMIHEQPKIMYLHFQGIGDLTKQANTIKKALVKTYNK